MRQFLVCALLTCGCGGGGGTVAPNATLAGPAGSASVTDQSKKDTDTGNAKTASTSSPAGAPVAAQATQGLRTKEFKAGRDLRVGDCLMRGNSNGDEARIYINSDGSARLRAYIRSEDSSDEFYLHVWGTSHKAPDLVFRTVVLKSFTMDKSRDQLWAPGFAWSATGDRFDDLDEIHWEAASCH